MISPEADSTAACTGLDLTAVSVETAGPSGKVTVLLTSEDGSLVHTTGNAYLAVTDESTCTATHLREYITMVLAVLDKNSGLIGNGTTYDTTHTLEVVCLVN